MYVDNNGEVIEGPLAFKTPFNHDTTAEANRVALTCTDKTLTQQQFREESDINVIIDRFLKTGLVPQIPTPPQYADISTAEEFHEYQNRLAETNQLFYKLPAAIRASYQNDPGQWLEDINARLSAGDLEPLREMGLDVPERTPTLPEKAATATDGEPPPADSPAPATP